MSDVLIMLSCRVTGNLGDIMEEQTGGGIKNQENKE
jgi:hypothetical protein